MPRSDLREQLTDVAARNAPIPDNGQYVLWDASIKRFGLRVSQGGSKSWIVMAPRRITIGRYPILSLQQARLEAKRVLAEATLGRLKPRSIPYKEARDTFLKTHHVRDSTLGDYRRSLTRHLNFESKHLETIHTRDITRVLDSLADRPAQARQTYAAASVFFRWCVSRSYLERSPCEPLRAPGKPVSRERVLNRDELRLVASLALTEGYPFGTIVMLCILTGQRRGEIVQLRRSWINEQERTVTLSATVTKNKRQHTFPYGDMVHTILAKLPRTGDLLFPARGQPDNPFSGWSKCKAQFDKKLDVNAWTLHDLRRTFSTIQAQLKTPPHITERILNHASGSLSPIALIYNRHHYLDECREAMVRYEQYIHTLVSTETP